MIEKRFAVTQTVLGSGIYDYQAENELCESCDEDAYRKVVKLLNELHEENQILEKQRKVHQRISRIIATNYKELKKENNELKQQREVLFIRERNTKNEWRELKEENKELREIIEWGLEVSQCEINEELRRRK